MTHYRLYFLNKLGRIVRREEVDVATDAEAAAIAREHDHAFAVEVWDGARQAATVHPDAGSKPDSAVDAGRPIIK